MSRRERSLRPDPALLVAAPALGFLVAGLATALSRWRWQVVCERVCGPFLPADWPPAWIESFRRAMDWQTPLAVAAVATLVLVALWAGLRSGPGSGRCRGAGDLPAR
jgi:hypothetical protein